MNNIHPIVKGILISAGIGVVLAILSVGISAYVLSFVV